MERYGNDISTIFPDFHWDHLDEGIALLIFRNMKPVGVFAFRELDKPGEVEVLLDYVIPEDRDFKTAKFMFHRHSSQLKKEGITSLVTSASTDYHTNYLKKVGFRLQNGKFLLDLK